MPIFKNTPPDVARARLAAWQRAKEFTFLAALGRLVKWADRMGLERKRIARVLHLSAEAISDGGLGGS